MTAQGQPIRFFCRDSVRTAYRQAGSGPLVLLIHGAEAEHTMFLGLMDALSDRFCALAYDQRDCGRTENDSTPYDLETLASDAAALIEYLLETSGERRVHVYGTSFGGQIAQVLAARHAQLVDRLILGSTWAVERPMREVNPGAMERLARLRGQLPDSAAQIAAEFFSPSFLADRPGTVDLFRGSQRTAAQAARRARMMQSTAPAIDLADITAPTLLLAGGDDRLIPPAETFRLAQRIPNAHRQELVGLPHVAALEDPGRVAHAIMRFFLSEGGDP